MTNNTKARKTYVLGITGSIGCGKSLVGKQLQDMGVAVIDADHLSHELVNNPGPAYDKIVARFGADIATSAGGPIDRKKLGTIVFNDAKARADLEAILHPAIGELQNIRVSELAKTHDIVAVLVPLLFETGSQSKYSAVWAIIVHKEIQIQRLKLRDKLSDEEVVRRIKAQWPQNKKAEMADHVVDNSGNPEETRLQVAKLVGEIRAKLAAVNGSSDANTGAAPATEVPSVDAPVTDTGDKLPAADSVVPPVVADAPANGSVVAPVESAPVETAPVESTPVQTAPVESAPVETAPVESAPVETAPVETAPADPVAAEAADKRNHATLRQLGEIATDEALAKLGDTGTTSHREATASLTMVVKAAPGTVSAPAAKSDDDQSVNQDGEKADGTTDKGKQERELQVDVRMSVKNRPGTVDSEPNPIPGPNPNPNPNPTPNPNPNPGQSNSGTGGHGRHVTLAICFLALLAFLAFLVWNHHGDTAVATNPTPVVVTVNPTPVTVNPTPVTVNPTPVTVITNPTVVSPPVVITVPGDSACAATSDVSSEPPAFALRYLHNQVRWHVTKWVTTTGGAASCRHTTVEGYDANGNLRVRQFYGFQLAYTGQLTVEYLNNCTTQVDRFNEFNEFAGRSIYTADGAGKLVVARQFDGHQRPLYTVNVQRANDGRILSVGSRSFDAVSGRTVENNYFERISQFRAFLNTNFFIPNEVSDPS